MRFFNDELHAKYAIIDEKLKRPALACNEAIYLL